jgi:anhydro-N-acetylmuramic acid kinase
LPGVQVQPVEGVGWRGDALEAEAFAFLAVRSVKGLPLSVPTTTGVPEPMPGGVLYAAPGRTPGRTVEFNRAPIFNGAIGV